MAQMKTNLFIPTFPGFYGGWFDATELWYREAECMELQNFVNNDDWDFAPGWDNRLAELYADQYADVMQHVFGCRVNVESVSMWHPREYNFATDEITAAIEVDDDFVERVFAKAKEHYAAVAQIVKERHMLCSNELSEWLEDIAFDATDTKLAYLVSYILEIEESYWLEDVPLRVLDYAVGNGILSLEPTTAEAAIEGDIIREYDSAWAEYIEEIGGVDAARERDFNTLVAEFKERVAASAVNA